MGPSTQLFGVLGREVVHGRGKAGDEVAPDGCAGEGVEAWGGWWLGVLCVWGASGVVVGLPL